jgi:hypothetical protein
MWLKKGTAVLETAAPVEIASFDDTDFIWDPVNVGPVALPVPEKEVPETGSLLSTRVGSEAVALTGSAFQRDTLPDIF